MGYSFFLDYDDTLGRTSDSTDLRGSMQYPDSLEGTGNYAQYAQTLEAMFTHSENDIGNKHRTGILVAMDNNHYYHLFS